MYEQPDVEDADWTPPANPDRPIPVSWMPRLRDGGSDTGTVRCTLCSWAFFGPIYEGMVQHKEHRAEHHPSLAAVSTRTKGQRKKSSSIKQAVADREERRSAQPPTNDVDVMVAELEKGPRTSRELGVLVGKSAMSVGVTLNWAHDQGRTTAQLNPTRGTGRKEERLWSLEPLPVPDDIQAVIKILQSGPASSADLADATGCLKRGMKWKLKAAVTRGYLSATCDDDGLWTLDEAEVESG